MIDESPLRVRYEAVCSSLDERGRRLTAAAEAKAAGYGGIAAAARATKLARSTIGRGLKDLRGPDGLTGKVRRTGGGRPGLTTKDPTLLADLRELLEPATMGDPIRPLLWVSKSRDKLATALRAMGHRVSSSSIPRLLGELKYCRHSNRKTKESGKHPDRDAQFEYINAKVEEFQAEDQPVISIDAKKKELLGEFKNGGSDYSPQGRPIEVNTHDFEDKELGKVVPYGVYDIGANDGYVSLGIDHDTGQFAVNSVRLWLDRIGQARYLGMSHLMITADGGGSNGSRLRFWKWSLQQLARISQTTFSLRYSRTQAVFPTFPRDDWRAPSSSLRLDVWSVSDGHLTERSPVGRGVVRRPSAAPPKLPRSRRRKEKPRPSRTGCAGNWSSPEHRS